MQLLIKGLLGDQVGTSVVTSPNYNLVQLTIIHQSGGK